MAQMTIYLDNELESKVKQNVAAMGISLSQFVSGLIRKELHEEWSPAIHQLAGAWDDFPDAKSLRDSEAHDCARESF
ncbi:MULTISPECIES: hypothetical protein [unclassified Sulfuricurvum]|uniref:hypothetical protein n=1 Tax=unclassified Sulfuricurvum TaxID=2632390 RepID=UPI000299633B|nr:MULTISPECIES: hypothetical protein [unclassified Sulfuricurvum]AFV96662.1 hypothetical protein B649_01740 [Candidatus Sulfuricurvum sp. RIFRC-1]OHD90419.1 MAG: CopG family transcriptional regulator [Sulfuricurvum sp. RIFCSPLOWO2_12_FULL_43_24]HBM36113.1 CopG family transcriptional regulator [Sulfuricurvum sp.]